MPEVSQFSAARLALVAILLSPQATVAQKDTPSRGQLDRVLQRFPQADADGDGVLTEYEARAFRNARKAPAGAGSVTSKSPPPARADVAYGPHERHVLDFWLAPSEGPTPVLIYFHGGSFKAGDKSRFREQVAPYLRAGISVVSANYRYSNHCP